MSYIGNTPTQQNFVAGADQFSGNGSTTAFTLSRNVNTVFDIFVAISNVPQDPYSAYSVSGNTLTFTSAPPSGTGNIYVVYRATNVQTFVPTQGVSPSFGNLTYTGTLTGSTGVMNIGSGQLYKDASGNVGIGTSSPASKLHVVGSFRQTGATAPFEWTVNAGGLDFLKLNAVGYADNLIVANSGGNVGIGTSSPLSTAMLEVSRSTTVLPTATVTADNQVTGWRTRRTGGSYAYEYYMGIRENSTALDFYDNTANALRARIDSSGNFIFRYVTATAPWDQNSAGNGAYAWLGNSTYTLGACNQNNIVGIFNRYQGNGVVIEIKNGTAVVGSISHNGSNTAYNTSSDYRLKENVQPMTGALEKVAALKPCTYTWKVDGSVGEGFIAHELAEVCPGAVTGEKDAVKEDGSINPQGIDTSFLVATLTAAIQELNAKVEAQAAEIAALKGAA